MFRAWPLPTGLLFLVFISVSACGAASTPGPDPPLARIVEVIDGDTIVIRSGQVTEPVRLIGIDTPEVAHHGQPDECFGPEAASRTEELLPVGSTVRLARDVEARDVYDRLLAYVFTTEGTMVNMTLAAEGLATELAISPNLSAADEVAEAVGQARTARVGLWASCPLESGG